MNFVEELRWRGMLHNIIPGTETHLLKEKTVGYVGFDPTADSLHIGSLVPIMLLVHLQKAGHKPIALVGGATGMVGDPSGKSKERNLLSEEILNHNLKCVQKQLEKFLDFDTNNNPAEIVNNYDWFKNMGFLEFIRDIGKHITINYMTAKDSVKKRVETGLSFTEFSYQLVQGYDFYWLLKHKGCKLQMGGSDQWGNITTGTELIRKMDGQDAFALTCPLVTKADGGKFGKTEEGNIWLDPEKTSPYKFYQFWLNCSDADISNYIRTFSLLSKEEIESLEAEHTEAPHKRLLQRALAKDITIRVHSEEDYNNAVKASEVLFGKSTKATLQQLSTDLLMEILEGVPQFTISSTLLSDGVGIIDLLAEHTNILNSKGEARRALKEGSLNINQEKVTDAEALITKEDLINNQILLFRRGKKNYSLIKVE